AHRAWWGRSPAPCAGKESRGLRRRPGTPRLPESDRAGRWRRRGSGLFLSAWMRFGPQNSASSQRDDSIANLTFLPRALTGEALKQPGVLVGDALPVIEEGRPPGHRPA